MADAIAITKADGDNLKVAKTTQADFQHALHLQQRQSSGWIPKVVTCSALEMKGLPEIQNMIRDFKKQLTTAGYFEANRQNQHTAWFSEYFNYLLSIDPKQFSQVAEAEQKLKDLVRSQNISPRKAARQLLDIYHESITQKAP